jgi:hypothetical protein
LKPRRDALKPEQTAVIDALDDRLNEIADMNAKHERSVMRA